VECVVLQGWLTEIKETPTGTIETVEGFEPQFKGKVVFGADWLEFDPDQKHATYVFGAPVNNGN
jgi:hypothetical protein